ncbi:MAG: F0F1 ATP synthase subunit epsilon [Verrucomicrobiota bacterium]|jgi:F-type H+-transporting ATPase subunit epsilon
MNLKILLPFQVFAQLNNILSVVAQTPHGSFGLLPQRLDCVTALSPGILTYVTAAGDNYVAVDEGVLIKTGSDVLISVRHAIGGSDLGQLRAAVENEFLKLDEQQTSVRTMLAKLESSFIARFVKYNHG